MKTINERRFHGEPSKTTHRKGLTEQISANRAFAGHFQNTVWANATLVSHLKFKSHSQMNLHDELEEEEKMLMSMENAAGIAVRA